MRFYFFLFSITVLTALAFKPLYAQIPRTLSYQGRLTDSTTGDARSGEFSFTFKLYDSPSGGTQFWNETKSLTVTNGLFSTALGDDTPFGSSVLFDKPYWLSIQVKSEGEKEEQLSPRIPLTSVGYSLSSLRADTAMVSITSVGDTTWQTNVFDIYRLKGNVGVGTTNPQAALHIYRDALPELIVESGSNSNPCITLKTGGAYGVIEIKGLANNDYWTFGRFLENGVSGFTIREPAGSRLFIQKGGNVGIGTTSPTAKLEVIGRTKTKVLEITGGADLAEPFEMSDEVALRPGSLVIIDPENPGKLKQATEPYDKRVAGVISGAGGIKSGLRLSQEGLFDKGQDVALTGKIYALSTTENGVIEPGDLLTTSSMPGHAMKATDQERSFGAVIGKAMSRLSEGEGLVLVLIQPH